MSNVSITTIRQWCKKRTWTLEITREHHTFYAYVWDDLGNMIADWDHVDKVEAANLVYTKALEKGKK